LGELQAQNWNMTTTRTHSFKCMSIRRLLGVGALIIALVGLVVIGTRTSGQGVPPADEPARTFFARHCQACHAGAKPKAKVHLDSLSADFSDKANRERWLTVLEQLKSGTMPPKEIPRPPAQDVRALSDWILGRVEKGAAGANARQGRVGLRRLNRTEYE